MDNRAFTAASRRAAADDVPLVVLFVFSPGDYAAHDTGRRRVDFTLRNLAQIKVTNSSATPAPDLADCLIRSGRNGTQSILAEVHIPLWTVTHFPRRTVPARVVELMQSVGAMQLYANLEYGVDELRRDARVCALAKECGMCIQFIHDRCIVEPGVVRTKDGRAYTVYSPFQRRWIAILNDHVAVYLAESPAPKGNASRIREDPVFGPLFSVEVPTALEGFELDEEEAATMARLWPAGTNVAQEVSLLYLGSPLSCLNGLDPFAFLAHRVSCIAARPGRPAGRGC